MKVFTEWKSQQKDRLTVTTDPDTCSAEELNDLLRRFYATVQSAVGEPYSVATIVRNVHHSLTELSFLKVQFICGQWVYHQQQGVQIHNKNTSKEWPRQGETPSPRHRGWPEIAAWIHSSLPGHPVRSSFQSLVWPPALLGEARQGGHSGTDCVLIRHKSGWRRGWIR